MLNASFIFYSPKDISHSEELKGEVFLVFSELMLPSMVSPKCLSALATPPRRASTVALSASLN